MVVVCVEEHVVSAVEELLERLHSSDSARCWTGEDNSGDSWSSVPV